MKTIRESKGSRSTGVGADGQLLRHTRIQGDQRFGLRSRTLCGLSVLHAFAGSQARSIPSCSECLVLRDAWKESSDKPPSLRRFREWLHAHKELWPLQRGGFHIGVVTHAKLQHPNAIIIKVKP